MSDYALSELMRRIERIVVVATVVSLDRGNARAKVEWSPGVTSDWLAVAQLGSAELPVWFPPNPGTQVMVLSPGGDTRRGVIMPGPFKGSPPAGNFAGDIIGEGDVVASDISLVEHVHGGIIRGGALTDPPE